MKAARYGRRSPALTTAGRDQSKTFPASLHTTSDHRAGMAAETTSPAVPSLLIEQTMKISRPLHFWPNVPADTPPGSSQPPLASSGCSTNHLAPATASTSPVSPLIQVKELDNSIRTPRPASKQPPKALNDDVPDLSTEEHVLVLS